MVNKGKQGRKILKLLFLHALDLLKMCLLKISSNKYHKSKISVDFSTFKYQSLSKRIFTYVCCEIKFMM